MTLHGEIVARKHLRSITDQLASHNLSSNARYVAINLAEQVEIGTSWSISITTWANEIGLDRRVLAKALAELEQSGVVETNFSPRRPGNIAFTESFAAQVVTSQWARADKPIFEKTKTQLSPKLSPVDSQSLSTDMRSSSSSSSQNLYLSVHICTEQAVSSVQICTQAMVPSVQIRAEEREISVPIRTEDKSFSTNMYNRPGLLPSPLKVKGFKPLKDKTNKKTKRPKTHSAVSFLNCEDPSSGGVGESFGEGVVTKASCPNPSPGPGLKTFGAKINLSVSDRAKSALGSLVEALGVGEVIYNEANLGARLKILKLLDEALDKIDTQVLLVQLQANWPQDSANPGGLIIYRLRGLISNSGHLSRPSSSNSSQGSPSRDSSSPQDTFSPCVSKALDEASRHLGSGLSEDDHRGARGLLGRYFEACERGMSPFYLLGDQIEAVFSRYPHVRPYADLALENYLRLSSVDQALVG